MSFRPASAPALSVPSAPGRFSLVYSSAQIKKAQAPHMPASAVVKPTTVVLPPMPAPTAAGAAKKAKTAPAGEVDQEENPRGAYRFA